MTRLGADATGTSVAELKALGATFVSRYVSDFPWKNLTLAEAHRLSAAGLDVVTNWENDVDDWASGRGTQYAQRAAAQHAACGGPAWAPVYFSVDQQVDPNSPVLHRYFRDINSVLGVARTGVYGQTSVLRVLRSLGLVRYTWRSMSTFGLPEGLGLPGEFDVEQTGAFNATYDRDVANSTNFGQWRIGVSPPPTPTSVQGGPVYLISVSPDPSQGGKANTTGVFAVHEGLGPVHVDPASFNGADFVKNLGPVTAVSPAYYAALVAASAKPAPAAVALSDAQASLIGAAIAAKLPTHITGTQTTTVSEDLT